MECHTRRGSEVEFEAWKGEGGFFADAGEVRGVVGGAFEGLGVVEERGWAGIGVFKGGFGVSVGLGGDVAVFEGALGGGVSLRGDVDEGRGGGGTARERVRGGVELGRVVELFGVGEPGGGGGVGSPAFEVGEC